MNRRTAMFVSLLMGGLFPRGLLAQESPRRTASRSRGTALEPAKRRRPAAPAEEHELDAEPGSGSASEGKEELDDASVPNLPAHSNYKWRTWDIRRYTSPRLPHGATTPHLAILEWIYKRTTDAVWHGEKPAVLSVGRNQVRAYHDPETLNMVDEVVERFVQAEEDILSVHVRIIRTDNVRWRYPIYSMLGFKGSGPQGQQIWELDASQAALVLAQLQVHGHKMLVNKPVEMINGQKLKIDSTVTRGYIGGTQHGGNAAMGAQGRADQLVEGVWLHVSPLLTFDADAVDVSLELTSNTVRNFHNTRVIAPREYGSRELEIAVPEVSQTFLSQTVKDVKIGKTLLISGGIQPGLLDDNKHGFLNMRIPGTYSTNSELLVFVDVNIVKRSRKAVE